MFQLLQKVPKYLVKQNVSIRAFASRIIMSITSVHRRKNRTSERSTRWQQRISIKWCASIEDVCMLEQMPTCIIAPRKCGHDFSERLVFSLCIPLQRFKANVQMPPHPLWKPFTKSHACGRERAKPCTWLSGWRQSPPIHVRTCAVQCAPFSAN